MKRFFKKWYIRFITYRVTMKCLSNPHADPYDFSLLLEAIERYVGNITSKNSQ
jgi:hypothetical protein